MKKQVFIPPEEIWDYFVANRKEMMYRYVSLAENDCCSIQMTADDDGLVLCYDCPDDYFCESCCDREEAERSYRIMLEEMDAELPEKADEADDPDPEEPTADDLSPVLAATYAYTGVLLGFAPDELGLTDEDLEEIALQVSWFLKGRHDLETVLN